MAVGAVALSLPVALVSSFWMSVVNGLEFWQGLATYSLTGTTMLVLILATGALVSAEEPA